MKDYYFMFTWAILCSFVAYFTALSGLIGLATIVGLVALGSAIVALCWKHPPKA